MKISIVLLSIFLSSCALLDRASTYKLSEPEKNMYALCSTHHSTEGRVFIDSPIADITVEVYQHPTTLFIGPAFLPIIPLSSLWKPKNLNEIKIEIISNDKKPKNPTIENINIISNGTKVGHNHQTSNIYYKGKQLDLKNTSASQKSHPVIQQAIAQEKRRYFIKPDIIENEIKSLKVSFEIKSGKQEKQYNVTFKRDSSLSYKPLTPFFGGFYHHPHCENFPPELTDKNIYWRKKY